MNAADTLLREPYAYRGGTPLDPEAAVPVWADGPAGRALHGFLDARQGVYQTVGQGWNDFHLATRQVTLPTAAWNVVWDRVSRLEFVDHADNRVLVLLTSVARKHGREIETPAGRLVAFPIEVCRLWTPPLDAEAAQPHVGQLTPAGTAAAGRALEAAVDGVDTVPARPQAAIGRILLDAGPSERGWHHAQTMLACPQLYAYRYITGTINATRRPPLIKGSLIHIGLAHHYARLQATQLKTDAERFYDPETAIRLLAGRYGALWEEWVELAVGTVAAYIHYRAVDDAQLRVIAVEEQFRAKIAGHTFTQRADLCGQNLKTGLVSIIDHKSASILRKDTVDRYTLSGQFLGLRHFGPLLYGEQFDRVRVNFLSLQTDAEPRLRFKRETPEPAPHAMACFPQSIVDAEDEIRRHLASGRDPWYWPKRLNEQVCTGLYGPCDGHDWCQWGKAGKAA